MSQAEVCPKKLLCTFRWILNLPKNLLADLPPRDVMRLHRRQRQAAELDAWLQTCQVSPSVELQNFVDVLQRDYAAVKAALMFPWSNGPVEGHINRLKLIKRSGYGRMQLDLLRQRVLYDAA